MIIIDKVRDYVLALINHDPIFYLDKIVDFIFIEFSIILDNP
jgi:hypothetical protein